MMHPTAEDVVPMFSPLLLNEPIPTNGRLKLHETPGFGVELNPEVESRRPFCHRGVGWLAGLQQLPWPAAR